MVARGGRRQEAGGRDFGIGTSLNSVGHLVVVCGAFARRWATLLIAASRHPLVALLLR